MKQIVIASILSLGLMLSGISTVFASAGNLAVAPSRMGSTELNPQPEVPGATERKMSTSTKDCTKDAKEIRNKAIAFAKINYSKAQQAASQAEDKALAHAKTLTDKEPKKAAILKAHRDFEAAMAKARSDKNSAIKAANQAYKNAILTCKTPSSQQ